VTAALDEIAPPVADAEQAYAEFRNALLDFADVSTAQNFRRYQAASRALAEARRPRVAPEARTAPAGIHGRSRRRRSAPRR